MSLDIQNVSKIFPGPRKGFFGRGEGFTALDDVSLSIKKGASFGLVGESGSGKTTLTRCILRLESLSAGNILFDGSDIHKLTPVQMRRLRSRLQIVFQDPYASLDPRMTVHDIVAEPLVIHGDVVNMTASRRSERVMELLLQVGLRSEHLFRYPHEFSGGQRQTHRHCAGAGGQAGIPDPRRADLGLGRFGPGGCAEPSAPAAGRARPDLLFHQPRSRRHPLYLRRCCSDLSRKAGRARTGRLDIRQSAERLYTHASGRDAGSRSRPLALPQDRYRLIAVGFA
jgi:ABC-type lipoprotein export system ATPase subunit